MSVQLSIYPQYYEGQFNIVNLNTDEFIIDGLIFLTINSAPSHTSTSDDSVQQIIDAYPPSIANTWYRYTTGTTLPSQANGNLTLTGSGTGSPYLARASVYQKVTNLTPGASMNLAIETGTVNTGGFLSVYRFTESGLFLGSQTVPVSSNLTNYLIGLPVSNAITNNSMIIVLDWLGIAGSSVEFESLGYIPNGVSPNFTNFELADGQVILDLYEDEDIPLTLSVDNFKNAAEKVQSYSKAFKLPGSKRNNLIFDNLFDVTRSNEFSLKFNPYRKTRAILKQDGFILFEGYLRLLDISEKENEISYNVNLYSDVVALADHLKERNFSNLDFTELSHLYNRSNIELSYNSSGSGVDYLNASTSGFRDANSTVKYPLCDWDHQFKRAMMPQDIQQGATFFNPMMETISTGFRPWINIKYLIDRIFSDSLNPFEYESEFFETDDFKNLYMDFNWGSDVTMPSFDTTATIAQTGPQPIATSITDSFAPPYGGAIYGTNVTYSPAGGFADLFGHAFQATVGSYFGSFWTAQYNGQVFKASFSYTFEMENQALVKTNIEARVRVNKVATGGSVETLTGFNIPTTTNDGLWKSGDITPGQTATWAGDFEVALNIGEYFHMEIEFDNNPAIITECFVTVSTIDSRIVDSNVLGTLRGELKQWEFLKGIMTMFNLISLPNPNNPNLISFEPYGDIFINNTFSSDTSDLSLKTRSIQHDWTELIDVSEIKLEPIPDLTKNTHFRFVEEEDDYMLMNYKKSVPNVNTGGHDYGSLFFTVPSFNMLEGVTEINAEPFSATIVKPLMTQFLEFELPSIYSLTDNGESEGFENAPRILFNNGVKTLGNYTPASSSIQLSYFIPNFGTSAASNATSYLQFSQFTTLPPVTGTRDFFFGPCQLLTQNSNPVADNLYSLYWSAYFNELYNPDVRTMSLKVNLNAGIINTFKFNDTVFIKNRTYRVNKIDYKPNDLATVEFILIP